MGASFNSVILSEDTKTVKIASGAVWRDVYPVLEPHGLMVDGARHSDVGVGGFALGGERILYPATKCQGPWQADNGLGGLSYFNAHHGFTSDRVLEYEVGF